MPCFRREGPETILGWSCERSTAASDLPCTTTASIVSPASIPPCDLAHGRKFSHVGPGLPRVLVPAGRTKLIGTPAKALTLAGFVSTDTATGAPRAIDVCTSLISSTTPQETAAVTAVVAARPGIDRNRCRHARGVGSCSSPTVALPKERGDGLGPT